MSQDLARHPSQRSTNGAATYNSPDDLWMQQQALAVSGGSSSGTMTTGGGGNGDVQPLQIVHRSLRGRYKLAILLAAIGASVGTVLGWTSYERTYRAKGLVRILPDVGTVTGEKGNNISEYTRYMGSEASVVRSEEIAKRAMGRPEWVSAAGNAAWQPGEFMSRMQATFANNSQEIQVNFDNPNPALALAGIKSTLTAYADFRNEKQRDAVEMSAQYLERQKKQIQTEIENAQGQISSIRRENEKGNIEERGKVMAARLAEFEGLRNDKVLLIQQMESLKAKQGANPQANYQMLAQKNPFFARILNDRDVVAANLLSLQNTQGPGSPLVQKKAAELNDYDAKIVKLAATLTKDSYGFVNPIARPGAAGANAPVEVTDLSIANEKDNLVMLEKSIQIYQGDIAGVDKARLAIDELNNQIKAKRDQLDGVNGINALIDRAMARSQTVAAPFTIASDPTLVVQEDKRPTMATFGFVAGAGIPLLGLVAFGLMDRKYRYSDEATGSSGTRGVPLLGILPNLPDRLSDPSQASVAAHCVHQIRTMLQLNCLNDGPSVLSVTSATSGDGKTSLSLALGLSFAASGSRTLLVDTDLIGGGLSSRLGIREPTGISEAIATRDPMKFVRETDVADLSVLPVGANGTQNASAFSPTAVRRLVEEVRKHFDIVLIDTGPVLGSIEATPVVAASDAVILTVARGQNRDLVEKAISHLRTIGARIAGVVFNRANARDFERSISGISLRSVSRASASATTNTNGRSTNGKHQDKRLGPLVHSVRGTRDEN